jgi:nucleoside-diphosphate-sugar epimerase
MYLLTGSTGFIGQSIANELGMQGKSFVATTRSSSDNNSSQFPSTKVYVTGDINSYTNWVPALDQVSAVIHCAAQIPTGASSQLQSYKEANISGTMRLAQQAAEAGVQRFVFLSSIGVHGNVTTAPINETDTPYPHDLYTTSKLEAEQQLLTLAEQTGMEVVIIRPPLVYGPNAKGSFAALVKCIQKGIPLPLGAIHNKRSLIALENLTSLVILCADRIRSPQAANQIFVIADGEDVSTTTLLQKISKAAGRSSRLLPIPSLLLSTGATILGKRHIAEKLLGNFQVDASKARNILGWRPVITMDEQLAKIFQKH